jgi:hypothetical protein
VLASVHLTIRRWRFLDGPNGHVWLSTAAGTALAYVFTYLLPKLALTQDTIDAFAGPLSGFLRQQAYLLALIGLVTFFAIDRATEHDAPTASRLRLTRSLVLHLLGYSVYSMQLGYLLAELGPSNVAPYAVATVILSLHLMGIDHHIAHRDPIGFTRVLRWAFAASCVAGWAVGAFTHTLDSAVTLSSTFVAGGIIITAIREELADRHSTLWPFFVAVLVAATAIILVQKWQVAAP